MAATLLPTLLPLLISAVQGSTTFLEAHPQPEAEPVSTAEVEQILSELTAVDQEDQITSIQSQLRPLYTALPKNQQGRLDSTVVRYALHRYFAQKWGWHLRGLEPSGGAWNSTSPSSIMRDRAPSYIQGILEEAMHGQGLGLRELAVFAATLTHLVRQEAISDLEPILEIMEIPASATVSVESLDDMLLKYLMIYIKGTHVPRSSRADFEQLEAGFIWDDVKMWTRDLRRTIDLTRRDSRNPFSHGYTFEHSVVVAQEVGHRFGHFQNRQCHAIKEQLVDMEIEGSGRVPLTSFYSGIEDNDWPFSESAAYLRNVGALDETDVTRPHVIIPNFLSSPSNCAVPSSFYSVCCIDECESLLASVEVEVGEASATPALLAQIVSGLESDTVQAPRNLSAAQLGRLEEIAAVHGGRIPLHGRLFAQWMHHAYPRECRFPHESGTTSPLNQEEFRKKFGTSAEASDDEVNAFVQNAAEFGAKVDLPWTLSEELIAPLTEDWRVRQVKTPINRVLVILGMIMCAGLKMVRTASQPHSASSDKEKFCV